MNTELHPTPQFTKYSICEESTDTTHDAARVKLSLVKEDQAVKCEQLKRPGRKTNKELREREYLMREEVQRLEKAAKEHGRYGSRDALIIRLIYCHGLRVGELVNLKWQQYTFAPGSSFLHVNRLKHGTPCVHPIEEQEARKINKWRLEQQKASPSSYMFTSERGAKFSTRGIQKMIEKAGRNAGFDFPVHAHMLRHAKGYDLANRPGGTDTRTIQAFLGHRDIRNTVIYTSLSAARFEGLTSY